MSAGPAVSGGGLTTKVDSDASTLTKLRQWLMTGVSYMIPFVAAGGILIALSFMLAQVAMGEQGAIEIVKYGLTAEGEFNITQNFSPLSLTSWAALLFVIGGAAFGFLVPILSGFIAFAIADRPGLVPGHRRRARSPRRWAPASSAASSPASSAASPPAGSPAGRCTRASAASCRSSSSRCCRPSSPPGCSSPCSAARSWPSATPSPRP